MPGTNSILPFSGGVGANILTDADYLGSGHRVIGNQPGIASAQLNNKALRQATLMSAGLAQYIANRQGANIDDSLSPSQIEGYLATVVALGLTGPCFSVYQNNVQSIGAIPVKVVFDAEEFDTAGAFDSAGSSRFTPLTAGYYNVYARVSLTAPGTTTNIQTSIYKNGVLVKTGPLNVSNPASSGFSADASGLISMNGSTDYLEVWVTSNTTTSAPGSQTTYFQGSFARGL